VTSRRNRGGGIQTRKTEDKWSKGKRGTGENVVEEFRREEGKKTSGQKESEEQEKMWWRNSDEKKERRQVVKRKARHRRKYGEGFKTGSGRYIK